MPNVPQTNTYETINYNMFRYGFNNPANKQVLESSLDLYVETTGSDTNDGLTVGTAFQTIGHALDVLNDDYELNGNLVTINVGDGSFFVNNHVFRLTGSIIISGNGAANTTINPIGTVQWMDAFGASIQRQIIITNVTIGILPGAMQTWSTYLSLANSTISGNFKITIRGYSDFTLNNITLDKSSDTFFLDVYDSTVNTISVLTDATVTNYSEAWIKLTRSQFIGQAPKIPSASTGKKFIMVDHSSLTGLVGVPGDIDGDSDETSTVEGELVFPGPFADDTAAGAGGVAIGRRYYTAGGDMKIRLT